MTKPMYICHKCGKRFGPDDPDDPDYETKLSNIVVIQRFTEICGIADSIVLCPDCGRAIWDFAREEVKE